MFSRASDNCLPGFAALHRALTEGDGQQNAFVLGQNTNEPFYNWMDTHPVQRDAFHRFMDAQFSSLPTWLDVVDFPTEMAGGTGDDEQVVFVDVGGGNGSQVVLLKQTCPGVKGRLILQDQAYVLARAMEVAGMEKMAYDFLTEQPVKGTLLPPVWALKCLSFALLTQWIHLSPGARVYYFRQIMHNFDETCIRILQAQLPALGPRSMVVLDDKVLPDEKPPAGTPGVEYTAALGIAMKVMFDAQERREAHWRRLVGAAGLEVREIRKFTQFDDAVVIAAKKNGT